MLIPPAIPLFFRTCSPTGSHTTSQCRWSPAPSRSVTWLCSLGRMMTRAAAAAWCAARGRAAQHIAGCCSLARHAHLRSFSIDARLRSLLFAVMILIFMHAL